MRRTSVALLSVFLSVVPLRGQTKSPEDQKVLAEIEKFKAKTKVQEATAEKIRLDYEAQKAQTEKLQAENPQT